VTTKQPVISAIYAFGGPRDRQRFFMRTKKPRFGIPPQSRRLRVRRFCDVGMPNGVWNESA